VLDQFDSYLKRRTLLNSIAVTKVESEEIEWSVSGYRKPLHWVQKVSHLEDTLKFYQSNFGFEIYRHEEFSEGCEATCNGPYGGAWSKTMIGRGKDESHSFCLELVFNYGVNRYERGNDLRSIALSRSAFIGDPSQIGRDPYGRQFVETPDGHWLNLIDDAGGDSSSQNDGFKHISLHVPNLSASMIYYQKVLGANVKVNDDSSSALCTWDTVSQTGIELVELPSGQIMDTQASQGRFAIETEDKALEGMAITAQLAEGLGSGQIVHGPVSLEPHGEKVLILRDEDGHEFCFVDARGFKKCVDVSQRKGGNIIDWNYRSNVHKKATVDYIGDKGFSPDITVVEASTYRELVLNTKSDVLVDLFAPWCMLCARNKPVYEELARRITQINGNKIVFSVLDGSKTPFSLIEDDQLAMMLQWAKTKGFPSLFYLRGDDKMSPIEFDGDWTIEGLSAWISTHSSQSPPLDLSSMDRTPVEYVFEDDVKKENLLIDDEDDDDCGNCSL